MSAVVRHYGFDGIVNVEESVFPFFEPDVKPERGFAAGSGMRSFSGDHAVVWREYLYLALARVEAVGLIRKEEFLNPALETVDAGIDGFVRFSPIVTARGHGEKD